ncbi:hypothetical protein MTO96_026526 [Rhipicephalus appendiculatus]
MAPPQNRKRRSTETAQSVPKRRRSGNNPPSPGARVNVAVRVRPLSERESETSSIVRVVDDRCLVFDPKAEAEPFYFQGQRACGGLVKPNKDQTFMFDQVFDENKDNEYVFERTTKEMLTTLLEGCNCSVFAYGATGAGKTFTMLGSEKCPGVVSLTASELYRRVDKLRSEGQSCDVAVAYLEVYNEVVRDLLCPNGPSLVVRDDPAKGIAISNLSIHKVKESGALFELLLKGNRNRTQHATDANSESSRSHAIFQVYVTQTENVTSVSKGIRVSKMSFVDLAGSERAAAVNKNIKDRIREGTKINLSLLALGNCIDALSKGGAQRVPYRGSKLTHILKDSLGGTCRTLMIAAVSPSKLSYTDTHNTLKYAERAMKIELQAKKNVLNVNVHMSMYSSLIEEYKQKVEGLQRKLDKVEKEKSELEAEVVELKESLVTAHQDALLRGPQASAASIVPAAHNDALSTTPVLSPSVEAIQPSDDSRMAYFLDAARKIYAVRAKIIRQIWENETTIRTSVVKENWKQQVAKTVKVLQGCNEDTMKESERLDHFLQSQAAKRLAAKEKLEALHNERRRNFECSKDLPSRGFCCRLLGGCGSGDSHTGASGRATSTSSWRPGTVAAPTNGTRTQPLSKRPRVQVSHGQMNRTRGADGQMDLASLLHAPEWRLATTVRRKSVVLPSVKLDDSFEGCTGDVTFVRFPNGSPHPRRHRRSRSTDIASISGSPSWSSMQSSAANETFVSDTPKLRMFEPISSPQPSTSKATTQSRKFAKYRPSMVHKENSVPRSIFVAPGSIRSNPQSGRRTMRKSMSTSNLPQSMSAATPTSRTAFLMANRPQQPANRFRQHQTNRRNP